MGVKDTIQNSEEKWALSVDATINVEEVLYNNYLKDVIMLR